MKVKALELRDEGTFIALLAVDMNSTWVMSFGETNDERTASIEAAEAQRYLLRRVGYPCDGRPNIVITHMSADGHRACNDPHYWKDRTFAVAHAYIIEHWAELRDGDVVDVQFILGETTEPKKSERGTPR